MTCWHDCTGEQTLAGLETTEAGLSETQARRRIAEHGPNRLPEAHTRSGLVRFLAQFHNVLIYVLLGASVITALLHHVVDTLVILAVVVANAAIGFIQEGKAEKAMQSIRRMLAPQATVLRDGRRRTVDGETLVPGDIVLLDAGDKVPADLRLLQVHGLHVQEAILTGESVPVEKDTAPVAANAAPGDRSCMAFSGTLVTRGQGRGVVVATGGATEIGRISGLLAGVETLTTPLVRQMAVFARWLTGLILTAAGLILAYGYFVRDQAFAELFMAVVGLSVAAIPEGLPAVLTITLALGVQAMARRNAIVRRLPAIETLGAVSVICTDKTGTLTRNEMTVAAAVTHDRTYAVEGVGYAPTGAIRVEGVSATAADDPQLAELGRAAVLCNDAALHRDHDAWTVEGDPMEGALLVLAGKAGIDAAGERSQWPRSGVIPFDAAHRYMASLHRGPEGEARVFVKGAPERLLAMCREARTAEGTVPLDEDRWHARAEELAARGLRVLAIAVQPWPAGRTRIEPADIEGELTLVGLVGLIDPPRPEAIEAVAECRAAGIRVKMITGDHAGTAAAIGRRIGLQNPEGVLTGADLDAMDGAALAAAVIETDVFARTTPEHKLRLVTALQAHELTVAMTGDGVNDAPALKRADAGIAMGRKGSEAAREAAEIVLADDNFASIVAAVREGRTVYDNIRKVIGWTLPTNAGEAATIVVALLAGLTLPITPVQILWVNLITVITLGMALAFEPTEAGTMRRPPRARHAPLLPGTWIWQIVLVALLFLAGVFGIFRWSLEQGHAVELARTNAVNTLVVMEMFYLFFVRNIHGTSLTRKAVRGTRVVWLAVIAVTGAQFAITYLPPLQAIFGTRAVPLLHGLLTIAVGVALFAIVETEKQIRLHLRQPPRPG